MIDLKAVKQEDGVETEIGLDGTVFEILDEMSMSMAHIINMITTSSEDISLNEKETKAELFKSVMELTAEILFGDGYTEIKLSEDTEYDDMEEDLF